MTIRLENLVPLPMKEQDISGSGIWEAESVIFMQDRHYMIEAPSGKGKTTLLSILYGIRNDFTGEVYFDEVPARSLTKQQWSSFRKSRFSFIFQGLELFEDLTAMENIQLKNSITGHKTLQEIREMAGQLGMASFLDRKAGILSFGQQQRIAIIRSLCQPFEFLLADESFSHMDQNNSRIAFELMRTECERHHAGLILTTLNRPDSMAVQECLVL